MSDSAVPAAAPAAPADSSASAALTANPANPGINPANPANAPAVGTDDPAAAPVPPALVMPGKDATPEAWNDFYKALGRPETANDYDLPLPEGDDGKFAAQVKPMLHKHGLSAEQAKGLAADWNAMAEQQLAAQTQAQQAADTAAHAKNTAEAGELANEWGQANTANMEMAKRGIAQFIPGDTAQKGAVIAAVEKVLGYKETIKFFHGIGKGLAEGDAAGMVDGKPAVSRLSLAERLYGKTQ